MTRLWRISNYADLTGEGGLHFPGRWNSKGRPIIYTAEHSAGAMMEHLAHLDRAMMPKIFQLIEIEIGDSVKIADLASGALPLKWIFNEDTTRAIGDAWLKNAASLALRVPSVLVPDSWNVLLNPAHPDARHMKIVKTQRVPLDARLH